MSKLVYKENEDSLYIIGGYGSQGVNYKMRLSDLKWEQSEKSHSALVGEMDLELTFKEAVYFP